MMNGKAGNADLCFSAMPENLSAFKKAEILQKKAAQAGFDWNAGDQAPVIAKISEELEEVSEALAIGEKDSIAGELGDLLFAVIKLTQRCGIDPEYALSLTNAKFQRRLGYIEKKLQEHNKTWQDFSLDDLESLWEEAKRHSL